MAKKHIPYDKRAEEKDQQKPFSHSDELQFPTYEEREAAELEEERGGDDRWTDRIPAKGRHPRHELDLDPDKPKRSERDR